MEPKERTETPIKWVDYRSVNWSLYSRGSKWLYHFKPDCDFRKAEDKALALALHTSEENLLSTRTTKLKLSEPLRKFIESNCPATRFYEPKTIAHLLTPSSNILVDYTKSSNEEVWKFRLNPKHNDSRGSALNIRRGLNSKRTHQPYLAIRFNAYYDGISFVYYPHIDDKCRNGNDGSLSSPILQEELINLLRIEKGPIVKQPVGYAVKIDLFTPQELWANVKIDLKK
jgi:hypothetical protein